MMITDHLPPGRPHIVAVIFSKVEERGHAFNVPWCTVGGIGEVKGQGR